MLLRIGVQPFEACESVGREREFASKLKGIYVAVSLLVAERPTLWRAFPKNEIGPHKALYDVLAWMTPGARS